MIREAEISLEIPFHDCDPAGMVWHGHYAKYIELARCALLESFDYNYDRMLQSGYVWPVIDLRLRYVQPAIFKQRILVRATLVEWEHRLKIDYLIRDADSGKRMTKAGTVQVAVHTETREMCLMSPPVLFDKLGLARP